MVDVERSKGRARVALGASVLSAAGALAWFWYRGDSITGFGLAALLTAAGYWEYRRRIADVRRAARTEADAERRRRDRE
ncbi:hypothetical protein EKH57_04620 [Halorubrum sp. BOL3-1]|uniref:hypothetical protein n=1 Tax=Halorubrum sp. BOL3-1 TaxID=2497325 RepID=UPI0010051596|nr:hypothetical protein [Halorubrum sp. BOL3-1]QAU12081.1 hypothetical protein EKH57_04620 [Halorubrum sp. BOL3-1]